MEGSNLRRHRLGCRQSLWYSSAAPSCCRFRAPSSRASSQWNQAHPEPGAQTGGVTELVTKLMPGGRTTRRNRCGWGLRRPPKKAQDWLRLGASLLAPSTDTSWHGRRVRRSGRLTVLLCAPNGRAGNPTDKRSRPEDAPEPRTVGESRECWMRQSPCLLFAAADSTGGALHGLRTLRHSRWHAMATATL